MPARESAASMAMPPRSTAWKPLSAPSSLPIGVRAPETMTEPGMVAPSWEQRWSDCHDNRVGAPLLTRIDHVGVAVHDLESAIGFYESTFGLTVAGRETNEAQGV